MMKMRKKKNCLKTGREGNHLLIVMKMQDITFSAHSFIRHVLNIQALPQKPYISTIWNKQSNHLTLRPSQLIGNYISAKPNLVHKKA